MGTGRCTWCIPTRRGQLRDSVSWQWFLCPHTASLLCSCAAALCEATHPLPFSAPLLILLREYKMETFFIFLLKRKHSINLRHLSLIKLCQEKVVTLLVGSHICLDAFILHLLATWMFYLATTINASQQKF